MPWYYWIDDLTGTEFSVSRSISDRDVPPTEEEIPSYLKGTEFALRRAVDAPNVMEKAYLDGKKRPAFTQHKIARAIEIAAEGGTLADKAEAKKEAARIKKIDTKKF